MDRLSAISAGARPGSGDSASARPERDSRGRPARAEQERAGRTDPDRSARASGDGSARTEVDRPSAGQGDRRPVRSVDETDSRRPAESQASRGSDAVGSLDAATLRGRWSDILDAVRDVRKVAWILLSNANVESVDGSVVTLAFPREGDAKGFGSSGCDQDLADVIERMFGARPTIRTGVQAAPGRSGYDPGPREPADRGPGDPRSSGSRPDEPRPNAARSGDAEAAPHPRAARARAAHASGTHARAAHASRPTMVAMTTGIRRASRDVERPTTPAQIGDAARRLRWRVPTTPARAEVARNRLRALVMPRASERNLGEPVRRITPRSAMIRGCSPIPPSPAQPTSLAPT